MKYTRMPIEVESPEEMGYDSIKYNLAESSVTDGILGDLNVNLDELVLCYGDHKGLPELREEIASTEKTIDKEDVITTVGAAGALFMVATSLLDYGDHLIVVRPNYATNIETPRTIGCGITYLDLDPERGFALTPQMVKDAITRRTKVISVTYPHNPTGAMISRNTLEEIIGIALKHGCYVILDETYRELVFDEPLPVGASLAENVISVSSLSKTYGLPGIRLGWCITRDKKLNQQLLAAKEQIFITHSVVDEHIAYQVLKNREKHYQKIMKHVRSNFSVVKDFVQNEPLLSWTEPQGGVICFPRMHHTIDPEKFYDTLLNEHETYVGPGHWFEMDDHFFRLGYGWPSIDELKGGLDGIKKALQSCRQ